MKMNENTEKKDDDSSVRVALRIRPQLAREKIDMCQVCTNVVHGEPQVMIGKDKSFTFDFVFDLEVTQETIYHSCVKDLIEGCFEGYNATIFAYGQTGSGKTYTMGTGFDINISEEEVGIIPRAVDHLFRGIEECRAAAIQRNEPPPDFKVNTQFMEIYNEEIIDLLDTTRDPESRGRKSHIKIHEDAGGGIYVVGVTTKPVSSLNDTLQCLQIGSLSRATASTNMNSQSSRSHAIFTLHIKQTRVSTEESFIDDEDGQDAEPQQEFETLTAKFHFVDLAGSERLKRTGATGDRAKEGISINCGLLALGNVISALGDKAKRGSHVPYRDSKLTRLLQDSLGGNSRTLMIACISPSDRDFMETLNTLQYANRARNIRNKVIANQDKASKQLAVLRTEILKLQEELMEYKTGKRIVDEDGTEVISDVHSENKMLMNENDKLRQRVKALNEALESLTARNAQLMIEKATLCLGNAGGDAACEEVTKLVEGYVKEMEELRAKLAEAQSMADIMKKSTSRTTSRLSLSMMMSPMLSPVPASHSYEMPLSPEYSTSVLDDAKKDVQRLKKMMRSQSRISHESDKENKRTDDEKEKNEAEEVTEKQTDEKLEKETEQEVYDGLDEDEMEREEEEEELLNLNDEEEDGDGEDESSSDSEAKDSDNVHEDLAELTCEISIKQRLIEELELTQRRLHSLKSQYEEKVLQLQAKIKETELERDKVLANINQVENVTAEKAKKVRDEFERKLNDMQSELKKLNAAKKEHSKLIRNQSHYEKQLKTLQHELAEMKKTKVRLMKQIKEDSEKTKQSEARRNKELAQLRKEQLKKETRIRTLEQEKKQRELVLKRKQEEVETLRKRPKPMSSKVAGRVGQYSRPNTIPIAPVTSSPRRRRRGTAEFSAKAAKQKWDTLEKNVTSLINKKQTVTNIERDMDVWLKQREKFVKKLEKYMKEKDKAVEAGKSEEEIKEMTDVIESLNNQVEFAQDNIYECQTNIMQVEETNNGMETADTSLLVSSCNLEEARYLLEHFINLTITKVYTYI
ncbi:hypothetical protein ACJMK2_019542 [Sinanodonta woodiana]|uniref:Kinesin motor domain-containing protein n=1 Tax=Sinanodonta woodiana TaxID=1069815 RepID=A0ABD3TYS4_SINWO